MILIHFLTIVSFVFIDQETVAAKVIRPIVFLPALGMSVLKADIDGSKYTYTGGPLCRPLLRSSYTLWLDPLRLLPGRIHCLLHDLSMVYEEREDRFANVPGVSVNVSFFGKALALDTDLTALDWIGRQVLYLQKLVDYLSSRGYTPGKDFRAAPYDFRKGHDEELVIKLKALVEESYESNGQQRVVLMGHSLGGVLGTHFLQAQPHDWKNKYIDRWVAISAPLAGSVDAIDVLATGNLFQISLPYATDDLLRAVRSVPVPYYLLPNSNGWSDSHVLLEIEGVKFGLQDYETFFQLIRSPHGERVVQGTASERLNLSHPGVHVSCIYSLGLQTTSTLVYKDKKDFPLNPARQQSDGDSTVPKSSLETCLRWSSDHRFDFQKTILSGVSHMDAVRDDRALHAIYQAVRGD